MDARTPVIALALALLTATAARAQQQPKAEEPPRRRTGEVWISGTIANPAPRVYMGFGWRKESLNLPVVNAVAPGSPAEKAGFRVGDVMYAVDGRSWDDGGWFAGNAPGRRFVVTMQRGSEFVDLTIVSDPPRPRPAVAPDTARPAGPER